MVKPTVERAATRTSDVGAMVLSIDPYYRQIARSSVCRLMGFYHTILGAFDLIPILFPVGGYFECCDIQSETVVRLRNVVMQHLASE